MSGQAGLGPSKFTGRIDQIFDLDEKAGPRVDWSDTEDSATQILRRVFEREIAGEAGAEDMQSNGSETTNHELEVGLWLSLEMAPSLTVRGDTGTATATLTARDASTGVRADLSLRGGRWRVVVVSEEAEGQLTVAVRFASGAIQTSPVTLASGRRTTAYLNAVADDVPTAARFIFDGR